ncbi:hypothetical protein LUZ60_002150 [Juncus effusus]|nr:hypothetical protein LUZ60_002150 [Juncus effusus]
MAAMVYKILLAIMTIATIAQLTSATLYIESWDLQTNYTKWAASHTFLTGDTITLSYSPSDHNVLEVTKSNYDSCTTTGPISTDTSGNTMINLTTTETRYFICGFSGHCSAGMKLQLDVVSSPSGSNGSPGGIVIGASSPGSPPVVITSSPGYDSAAVVNKVAGVGLGLISLVMALLVL